MDEGGVFQATDVPEPRMEEEGVASKKGELGKGSPIRGLMDTPPCDPPPAEPATGPVELIVKEEAIASEKGEPSKERLVDAPMDTPSSNPTPAEPATEPKELIIKKEWIELCE